MTATEHPTGRYGLSAPDCFSAPSQQAGSRSRSMLSVAEVARLFGRKPRTVRGWIAAGKLPAVRIGRAAFIPLTVLERLGGWSPDEAASDAREIPDDTIGSAEQEDGMLGIIK